MMTFSFVITPVPPRSSLFPYTTLFRSAGQQREAHASHFHIHLRHARADCLDSAFDDAVEKKVDADSAEQNQNDQRDRKSTRLNSSHRTISYAVFCLKKNIKPQQILQPR